MIITHNKPNNLHLKNEHLHNLFLCNDTNLDENEHWGDEMKKTGYLYSNLLSEHSRLQIHTIMG